MRVWQNQILFKSGWCNFFVNKETSKTEFNDIKNILEKKNNIDLCLGKYINLKNKYK